VAFALGEDRPENDSVIGRNRLGSVPECDERSPLQNEIAGV
jgi:hypothetical protein